MRRLGAVLAGGRSSRFGSDKAEALLDGRTLLDRAVAALGSCCDVVAVIGRRAPGRLSIEDWPSSGLGPLGGLAGALRYAREHGFAEVLSVPIDSAFLPVGLGALLGPAPAFVDCQPVIGLWPVDAAGIAEAVLRGNGSRAVRHFAALTGARPVFGFDPVNINTPGDLDAATAVLRES